MRGLGSQNDYIELATLFTTVLVSNIPLLDTSREDAARRFISLVDEFYDRRVKLIVSADQPIISLYQGQRLTFEFERTQQALGNAVRSVFERSSCGVLRL